jgi:hypothetical protein
MPVALDRATGLKIGCIGRNQMTMPTQRVKMENILCRKLNKTRITTMGHNGKK